MGEAITSSDIHPSETAKLIGSSGCSDIQGALNDMAKLGIGVDDLDPEVIHEVIKTMASAKSVGAQAAPTTKK